MADLDQIRENVRRLMSEIPPDVTIVAATKGRTVEEISAALGAGITIVGENYIQETEAKLAAKEQIALIKPVPSTPEWHFIGHLQINKVKKAVSLFNMIETVDNREFGHCHR